MSDNIQVWVRNDKGQVYGPLSPPSVELLIDNGIITGRLQVSTNGENYVYPGRVPGLRMVFPRETWGDTVVPGDELDAQWSQVQMPAAVAGAPGSTPSGISAAPGNPVAGPGVPRGPVAGPGARAPMAGPAARAPAAGPRQHPAQRPVGRPGGVPVLGSTPSGIRSGPSGVMAAPAAPAAPAGPSVEDAFRTAAGLDQPGSPGAPRPSAPAGGGKLADTLFGDAPRPSVATPSAPRAAVPVASTPSGVQSSPSGVQAAPQSAPSGVRAAPSGVRAAPPPPSTGELSLPASGNLADTSTAELYYRAAASDANGLLTVKLSDRELVVHFRKGNPEFIDSTHPSDSLEQFLLSQRLATQEQISQGEAQKGRFGGELLPAMFGLGLLNPNAVFAQLGQRAGNILLHVLSAEQGEFAFDQEDLPPAKAMPLGNRWSLYVEQLRKMPLPEVKRRMAGAMDLPVMKSGGKVALSDIRLTPQETRCLNYFDGVRSLMQLIGDVPQEADTAVRTAFMLHPLELVSFAGVVAKAKPRPSAAPPPPGAAPRPPGPAAPPPAAAVPGPPVMRPPPAAAVPGPPVMRPPPAAAAPGNPVGVAPGNPVAARAAPPSYPGQKPPSAAPPKPPVPVGPSPAQQAAQAAQAAAPAAPARPVVTAAPPAPANLDAETKQLQQLLEQMKKQNYFEVLGLTRQAEPNQVKIAYLKAARSYHPDTVPPGAPEALGRVKADIFALIGEANRTLSDAKLRQDYVGELDAGGTGSKVDVEKLLRAEDLFNRGSMLVKNRKYPDAVKALDEAISCNPDEGEFYAWRGYAKYLAATDKARAAGEATKDVMMCMSKNPNVAVAYYFLGFIAKSGGDLKTAKTNFQKCVQLDPKHIDAQRELRTMK